MTTFFSEISIGDFFICPKLSINGSALLQVKTAEGCGKEMVKCGRTFDYDKYSQPIRYNPDTEVIKIT